MNQKAGFLKKMCEKRDKPANSGMSRHFIYSTITYGSYGNLMVCINLVCIKIFWLKESTF